jgi:hypothetical protein
MSGKWTGTDIWAECPRIPGGRFLCSFDSPVASMTAVGDCLRVELDDGSEWLVNVKGEKTLIAASKRPLRLD